MTGLKITLSPKRKTMKYSELSSIRGDDILVGVLIRRVTCSLDVLPRLGKNEKQARKEFITTP